MKRRAKAVDEFRGPFHGEGDDPGLGILSSSLEVNERLAGVFPAHPRTRQRIAEFGLNAAQLCLLDPLPYIEFLALRHRAAGVITDSGSLQEDRKVPCLTRKD